jgi:hypothetical protein
MSLPGLTRQYIFLRQAVYLISRIQAPEQLVGRAHSNGFAPARGLHGFDGLATFGDEVRADRIKQCIGNMIRQVMEPRGYRIDRQNVRIPANRGNMFTSATRYKLSAPRRFDEKAA